MPLKKIKSCSKKKKIKSCTKKNQNALTKNVQKFVISSLVQELFELVF